MNEMAKVKEPKGFNKLKQLWPEMTIFERFEYILMLFVSMILAIIIMVAMMRLVENVYELVVAQATHTTEYRAFQTTFGVLLTLLIAFEFRNSINAMLEGKGLLIQVKIVVLIAVLAIARKFLVMEPKEYDAAMVAAYAGVALSLGLIYWLLCRKDSEDSDLMRRL